MERMTAKSLKRREIPVRITGYGTSGGFGLAPSSKALTSDEDGPEQVRVGGPTPHPLRSSVWSGFLAQNRGRFLGNLLSRIGIERLTLSVFVQSGTVRP